jgi:hypothetical protein
MKSRLSIHWVDGERESQCAPNPAYPNGIDLDVTNGASQACTVVLPYPAKRCGEYVIECEHCAMQVFVPTTGRPDDPRSVKLACKVGKR